MNDKTEQMLRDEARRLATAVLRNPILGVDYRDLVCACYEDSAAEERVSDWMTEAGYSTRHDLFRDELLAAPKTNIAAWDGAYLIRVDTTRLLLLVIDATGVSVDGYPASGVEFADGALRFEASETSDWNAELRFSRIEPAFGTPLSDGGTFQRKCAGRIWAKEASKPEVANAEGATARFDLPPSPTSPSDSPGTNGRNGLLRAGALTASAGLLGKVATPSAWTSFVQAWDGSYAVTLIETTGTGDTAVQTYTQGPSLGIASTDGTDAKALVTYIDQVGLDLTDQANRTAQNTITFTSAGRTFALTFVAFSATSLSFSGKMYPGTTPPAANNITGVAGIPPKAPGEWGGAIITGTVLNALLLVGSLVGFAALFASVKFGANLTAENELKATMAEGNAEAVVDAQRKLDDARLAMGEVIDHSQSHHSDAKILSADPRMKVEGAAIEIQKVSRVVEGISRSVSYTETALRAAEADGREAEKQISIAKEMLKKDPKSAAAQAKLLEANAQKKVAGEEMKKHEGALEAYKDKAKDAQAKLDHFSEFRDRKRIIV